MEITTASKRIFIILLSLIGFNTAVFLYVGYFHHQFVLKTIVDEERKVATDIYNNTFEHIIEKYELIANNILNNPQIIDAFERKDRVALLKLTGPLYKDLLDKNPHLAIMHFHTADTHSFLRLHKPEKFGDDLSQIRHMINTVNQLKIKQIGIEVGRYGISHRIAMPVMSSNGKFLGVFEFGIDINYIFDLFEKRYDFKSILFLNKEIFEAILENNKNLQYKSFSDKYYVIEPNSNLLINHLPASVVSDKFSLVKYDDIDHLVFTVTDLKSVSKKDIGKVVFVKNLNFYTDQIDIVKAITFTSAALLLIFSFYYLRKTFSNYTSIINHYQSVLEIKNNTLLKLASIDHLTQISNRKFIDTILKKELKKASRYSRLLSILIFDIDDFKKVNDTYGHNVGDEVLKDISKVVASTIRESDYFGRWGGEEFIIIAPETSLESSIILAEKVRNAISTFDFSEANKVTCSIGISTFTNENKSDELINKADIALYEAKRSGKDKVLVYNT